LCTWCEIVYCGCAQEAMKRHSIWNFRKEIRNDLEWKLSQTQCCLCVFCFSHPYCCIGSLTFKWPTFAYTNTC
jgi:hypothetical protein